MVSVFIPCFPWGSPSVSQASPGSTHTAAISVPAAGSWPGVERVHSPGLGDAGTAGGAVPGHGGLCCHCQQTGHAGHLQPQPPGEGGLPRGDVGHGAATPHGKAHLEESKASPPSSDVAERGRCTYVRYIRSDKYYNDFFHCFPFKFDSEPMTFIIALDQPIQGQFTCTGNSSLDNHQ